MELNLIFVSIYKTIYSEALYPCVCLILIFNGDFWSEP